MVRNERMLKFNRSKKFLFRRSLILIILCGIFLYFITYYPQVKARNSAPKTNFSDVKLDTEKPLSIPSIAEVNMSTTTSEAIKIDKSKEIQKVNPNINATVNQSFFSNTVFVGDSVTEAIDGYDMLKDAKVVAKNGQTLVEANKLSAQIKELSPKKIFILLGTNDLLNNISTEQFVSYYENLIKLLLSDSPNAKIYVQSILPVEEFIDKEKPLLSNSRIDEFNKALKDMKKDSNVEFLNIASVYKNDKGSMYDGYTSEGIHLKFNYYNMWFNYLENNAK